MVNGERQRKHGQAACEGSGEAGHSRRRRAQVLSLPQQGEASRKQNWGDPVFGFCLGNVTQGKKDLASQTGKKVKTREVGKIEKK